MRILCIFGQHNYGDPRRGRGYEYVNFLSTLRRLGHEVLFLDSWNRSYYRGFPELNSALLQMVEEQHPDVVLSVLMHYEIWLETWEILRDAGSLTTINWSTDDSWKYDQFSRLVAPAFHVFATTCPATYPRYLEAGISHVLLTQWGANLGDMRPPLPADECKYSVSFVGTAHGNRGEWVDELRRRGIEVTCFGHGWPRGPVAAEDIPLIIRSSIISLNFANSVLRWDGLTPRREKQIKARTFEVPGAGGFLLTEWVAGITSYYDPAREIETFRGPDELSEKIRYYLGHRAERDNIAMAGHERTCAEHTYDRRFAELLAFAMQQRAKDAAKPGGQPGCRIDWEKFASAVQQHKIDRRLSVLKEALVAACSIAWGPVRGPRAARRLVFELSWHLAGSRTYSASGWPGRMFYEVS